MHTHFFRDGYTKYLDLQLDPTATMVISGTQTWNTSRIVNGNVIIKDGAQLTIKCKVIMPPDGLITVEKGGRLIIDNGHLTIGSPKCGDYWGGIVVEGNPSATQTYANQGVLEIENDALIEYANTAVAAIGGGIVKSHNSTIKDCRYSFYFSPYQHPFAPWYSQNVISGCTFEVTDEYERPDLYPFVFFNGVSGIPITNCVFSDDRTVQLTETDNYAYLVSRGIQSINSNFRITGSSTAFNKLYMGIDVGVSGTKRNYSVRDATFNDCFLGIVSRSVPNFVIRDNTFHLGDYSLTPIPQEDDIPPTELDGVGISIQSGSGFIMRDNAFYGEDDDLPEENWNTLGIFISEIGGAANSVDDNFFENITIGNYAQGVNHATFPDPSGLQYLCNENTGDEPSVLYDFYVEPGGGISRFQGGATNGAGNTFRHNNLPVGSDFRNAPGAQTVNYFYYNVPIEIPLNYVNLAPFSVPFPGKCLEDTDDDLLGPTDTGNYTTKFDTNRTNYLNFLSLYQSYMDGGNKQALLNSINTAGPWNVSQLSSTLSGYTPYLSPEVLSAVAGQSLFSNSEVFNLAIANPESLRAAGLIDDLVAQRGFNTTEQSYLAYAAQNNSTARQQLEVDLHESYAEMQQAGRKLTISLMADTNGVDMNAIRSRLRLQGDLNSQYVMVESYWESALYDSANYVLQQLIQPQLTTPAMDTAFVHYDDVKQLHKSILDVSRDWDDLLTSEINQLEALAEGPWGMATAQARQVLNTFYGYHYLNLPAIPGGGAPLQEATSDEIDLAKANFNTIVVPEISASPNPTSGEVAFRYHLATGERTALLEVLDVNGRLVHRARAFGTSGTLLWQPEVSSGIYFYRLIIKGQAQTPQRLVILK